MILSTRLLDHPPAILTVPTIAGQRPSSSRRSELHKLILLLEAPRRPCVAAKKKRRKSDIVQLDHTVVLPSDMPLSSLLTQALRQIYDAFVSAVISSPSHDISEPCVDALVTEFLTGAVTAVDEDKGGLYLEGLETTQPQVKTIEYSLI